MLVDEIIPNKKLVWQCIDSYIDIQEFNNKSEWKGTKIAWEIIPEKTTITLSLTHIGLTLDFECYTECEKGWTFFLTESLYNLLTVNKGLPYTSKPMATALTSK